MVRKIALQAHLSAMREKPLSNAAANVDEESEEVIEEDMMETEAFITTDTLEPICFSDPVTLNYIADVFQL